MKTLVLITCLLVGLIIMVFLTRVKNFDRQLYGLKAGMKFKRGNVIYSITETHKKFLFIKYKRELWCGKYKLIFLKITETGQFVYYAHYNGDVLHKLNYRGANLKTVMYAPEQRLFKTTDNKVIKQI